MAALVWAASIILCSLTLQGAVAYNTTSDLQAVLSSIEKLVIYYQNNFKHLNLDGFFGLRVLEGQLQLLINEHQEGRHSHVPQDVINKIVHLKDTAQKISAQGLQFVQRDDSQYFKDFKSVVNSPWMVMKPHRKLQPSLRWEIPQYKAKVKVKLSEEISDKCMIELMNGTQQGCVISDTCAKIMTTRGLTGYGITHQLLWSIVAQLMPNCSDSVNKTCAKEGLGSIDNYQLELCTNNFYEMVAIVHVLMHGKIHESHQDLFLEEQFVCPNLGFYEFLKKDYLDQILSWQFPSGCFGEREVWDMNSDDNTEVDVGSLLEGYHDNKSEHYLDDVQRVDHQNNFVKEMNIDVKKENFKNVESIPTHPAANIPVKPNVPPLKNVLKKSNLARGDTKLRVPKHIMLPKNVKNKLLNKGNVAVNQPEHNVQLQRIQQKKINGDNTKSEHHETVNNAGKDRVQSVLHNIQSSDQGHFNSHDPSHRLQESVRDSEALQLEQGVQHVGRRLLVEKDMDGGCLSHKTGVAGGALVMYLRYLIDPGDIKWTGQHELFLSDTRSLLEVPKEELAQEVGEDGNQDEDEEEEEEEGDEGDMEEDGVIEDAANYNADDEGDEGEDDEEGDDYNDDGADGYNNNDEGNAGVKEVKENDQFGASQNSVNEDNDRDIDNVNKNGKLILDQHVQLPHEAVVRVDGNADEEEAPNYYDDDGETERGIIKRRKPPTPRPHPPVKTRRKHSGMVVSQESLYNGGHDILISDQPNYFVILLVSVAPFFILFFFLFKFIRKRRVHIRYYF